MALLKYGSLVVDIKGSINGHTFQGCRGGSCIRTRPISNVVKSRSKPIEVGDNNLVYTNRLHFSTVTKLWGQIQQSDRNSWASLLGIWTFTNKFGDVYNATPYQIFCAFNMLMFILEESLIEVAPLEAAATDPVILFTDYIISGAFTYDINDTVPVGQKQVFFVSQQMTESNALDLARFNKMLTDGVPIVGTYSLKAAILTHFNFNMIVGSVFYIRYWTALPGYPRVQFEQVAKIKVLP